MNRAKGPTVTLQLATRSRRAPRRSQVRRWAAAVAGDAEVTVRVVGAREARALNLAYRGKDYATNVLAFDYGARARAPRGDVVLCAPVIAREARQQEKSLEAHYAHLTVHGLLHLRGYDHGTPAQADRMQAKERAILRRLGYPDPYRS